MHGLRAQLHNPWNAWLHIPCMHRLFAQCKCGSLQQQASYIISHILHDSIISTFMHVAILFISSIISSFFHKH